NDLIFAFAMLTELRPEEYLGLPRQHLELVKQEDDKERGLVRVRQVAVKLRGGDWTFLPPKTKRGKRDVPFPAWLYHELMRFAQLVDTRRRLAGISWVDHNLVFPPRYGLPQSASWLEQKQYRSLLK